MCIYLILKYMYGTCVNVSPFTAGGAARRAGDSRLQAQLDVSEPRTRATRKVDVCANPPSLPTAGGAARGAGAAELEEEGDAELPERHSRPSGHAGTFVYIPTYTYTYVHIRIYTYTYA